MPHLPNLTWKQFVKLAEIKGYVFARVRGSHVIYENPEVPLPEGIIPIPRKKNIPKDTRRALLRQLGVSPDDVQIFLETKQI